MNTESIHLTFNSIETHFKLNFGDQSTSNNISVFKFSS